MRGRQHWEDVYRVKPVETVSWFEPEPATSLRLILAATEGRGSVVNVGGGASTLVEHLLGVGFAEVTVLDLSATVLEQVAARLTPTAAARVSLICTDLLDWHPADQVEVWHDRAVFHFLTHPAAIEKYVALATATVRPGGTLVLGTFAADGPRRCSGLPTNGYRPDTLAGLFGREFELVADESEEHRTPSGALQAFTWITLRRRLPPRLPVSSAELAHTG